MKKTLRISIYFFVGAFLWILIFVKVNNIEDRNDFSHEIKSRILGPCSVPLYYSLGSVDSRFGVSKEEFLEAIKDAESVWEGSSGRNLFEFKEDSKFKINLIFDERQLGTLERKKLELKFKNVENLQKNIGSEYEKLLFEYDKKTKNYEKDIREYREDLNDYNETIAYWNRKGGAPEKEYEELNEEAEDLEGKFSQLEKEKKEINLLVKKINSLAEKNEKIVADYNQEAETYRKRFGEAREFDQGLYTGEKIDIYQFNEKADLELVLAHELGHYLGLDHLNSPNSIMYYLMGEQDLENIKPTQEDLGALKKICR